MRSLPKAALLIASVQLVAVTMPGVAWAQNVEPVPYETAPTPVPYGVPPSPAPPTPPASNPVGNDVIYLRDGGSLRGTIIDAIPNQPRPHSARDRRDCQAHVEWSAIDRIQRASVPQAPRPREAPRPAYVGEPTVFVHIDSPSPVEIQVHRGRNWETVCGSRLAISSLPRLRTLPHHGGRHQGVAGLLPIRQPERTRRPHRPPGVAGVVRHRHRGHRRGWRDGAHRCARRPGRVDHLGRYRPSRQRGRIDEGGQRGRVGVDRGGHRRGRLRRRARRSPSESAQRTAVERCRRVRGEDLRDSVAGHDRATRRDTRAAAHAHRADIALSHFALLTTLPSASRNSTAPRPSSSTMGRIFARGPTTTTTAPSGA